MHDQLFTFDPGLRCSGIAYFEAGELKWASLAYPGHDERPRDVDGALRMAEEVVDILPGRLKLKSCSLDSRLVYEKPQIYKTRDVRPDDVMQLAYVNGAVGALLNIDRTEGVFAREWKGQIPKDVTHRRVRAELSDDETELIDSLESRFQKSLFHNLMDAVAIGMSDLERVLL